MFLWVWLGIQPSAPAEPLRALVETAWRENPKVAAAWERVRGAAAEIEGADGFFDPRVSARASLAEFSSDLYGLSGSGSLLDDTVSVQAGVEQAFRPGVYIGLGGEQGRRTGGSEADRDFSRVGARLRIPLLRDRGFLSWRTRRRGSDAGLEAARARLLHITQRLELDVELRYIELQTAFAQRDVAKAATARAERLFRETREMAELNATPAYHVHAARLEIARRREEQAAAEQAVRSTLRRLEELVGGTSGPAIEAEAFLAWGGGARDLEPESAEAALARRGDYLEQVWRVAEEAAKLAAAQNAGRQDLSLEAGYSRGETEIGETRGGGDISLVWRHAFGNRSAAAEARAREAALHESLDLLRGLEREILADLDIAAAEFRSARDRMNWMEEAVTAARSALDAEEERFRLGEGAGRQALDAQKDLTDILRRQNDVVSDGLQARARWRFAAGLGGLPISKRTGNNP